MNKIKSPETILDKWYKPRMHWKTFNRGQVIRAMEEYHNQFKQPDMSEWQLCPKCYGDGNLARYNSPNIVTTDGSLLCDVCKGNKIIMKPIIQPDISEDAERNVSIVRHLEDIMSQFGEVHNMLAKTPLPKEQYQPISSLLATAKVGLFNIYNELKNKITWAQKVKSQQPIPTVDEDVVRLLSSTCVNSKHIAYWLAEEDQEYCQCVVGCKVRIIYRGYEYIVTKEEYLKLKNNS